MSKKIIAFMLALLTLAPALAACSGDDTSAGADTTAADNGAAETTAAQENGTYARSETPDDLPDLNFDGQTITFYHRNHDYVTKYQMQGENNGGDVLFDAVYERNQTVQDRLNVKFEFKTTGENDLNCKQLKDSIPKEILAGDASWDVLFMSAQFGFTQTMEGYYADIMDLPYVNIDQPWWWNNFMEEQSIDTNRRYMLSGDLTLHALMSATAAYFNKNMFETINGDIAQLYELVDNGTWTFDKFLEYCEGAYSDVNGDGARDEDDVYGARHTSNFHAINYVSLSSGLNMHGRDENGLPVLDVYNENWIKWMEYIKEYMTDTYSKVSAQPNVKYTEDYFVNEKSMFSMGMLYDAAKLRDSEFDYGIVPFPKFSESVDYKSSGATPNADAIMIPVTTDPALYECIGASLEALCAQSYRNVTELYYETTLKGKYLGSENDIRMVDIIYKNLGTNFVMVAGEVLGGGAISSMYTYAYQQNDSNLTSYYDANKIKFEALMDEMLEKYYALG